MSAEILRNHKEFSTNGNKGSLVITNIRQILLSSLKSKEQKQNK